MPKKVKPIEEEEEEQEEEDEEEEDDLELEEEEVPQSKHPVRPKPFQKKAKVEKPAEQPKKRFMAFANPARVGVADSETGEVVGEGETAVLEILADILEKLERIENTLGNMVE